MKLLAIAIAAPALASPVDEVKSAKRYNDLKEMATKVFDRKRGIVFDERQMWAYGCHCMFLGDRPLSEFGMGGTVDAYDVICKKYKECNRCVKNKHGDECIGEMVKYKWDFDESSGDVLLQNKPGTCKRELGECDRMFANAMVRAYDTQDVDKYSHFYSIGDSWNPKANPEQCPKGSGGDTVHYECCGGVDKPFFYIHPERQDCCADHVPRDKGTC